MWTIAVKELKNLLYSPVFIALAVCAFMLIAIALFNGYSQYRLDLSLAAQTRAQHQEELSEMTQGWDINNGVKLARPPYRLSIFALGATGAIGREARISNWGSASVYNGRYEQDPVLALFGELDLTFIVGSALSLFALLLSFNAVSGEREAGTLQLLMANPVRRSSVILGKIVGGYLPLALLFIIPFLLGIICLITFTDVRFSADEWLRIALMGAISLLYLAAFHISGVALSALTRSSFISFILCLLVWVLATVVLPPFAVHAARVTHPSMSSAEYMARQRALWDAQPSWEEMMKEYLESHPIPWTQFNERRQEMNDEINKIWQEQNNKAEDLLEQEHRARRAVMARAGMRYALFSPTAGLHSAMMLIADSGPSMLEHLEASIARYQVEYRAWGEAYLESNKAEMERRQRSSFYQTFKKNADGTISITVSEPVEEPPLDLSGMPQYTVRNTPLEEVAPELLLIVLILAITAIIPFAVAWVAFLRYDVR